MTLDSLERLRERIMLAHHDGPDPSELSDLFNAIECEVEERFMPLPTDADGVPLRVGDVVASVKPYLNQRMTVTSVAEDYLCVDNYGFRIDPDEIRHQGDGRGK